MKQWRKVAGILAAMSIFLTTAAGGITAHAAGSWPSEPQIQGETAIVMEAGTGAVLYEKNAHMKSYPASITKILTALLAIETTGFDEQVTFSHDAVFKTEGSGIWRDEGEVMTMEECLYALMLESANECAYAIAEHAGGTFDNFVESMNARAAELGCTDTHFANPHGLTDENHFTSCYDMALIAREAIKNETFRKIAGTVRYDIPPTNKHDEITYLTNHHKMLKQGEKYYDSNVIAGKTGYTEAAGSTLVTFAEKNGMVLICVVMREKQPAHWEDTRTLLNWCYENFTSWNIAENLGADAEKQEPQSLFLEGGSFADLDRDARIVLPVDVAFQDADMELVMVKEDPEVVATLEYSYGGHNIGSAKIARTRSETEVYPFQPPEEESGEGEETKQTSQWIYVIIAGCIVALAILAFGICKLAENFYLIRYKLQSRRGGDLHTHVIKRKSRRRRRR